MKKTFRNDSSFAVQFSISLSKTRAIFKIFFKKFKIKIKLIEMFELEYQATIPLKIS